MVGGSPFLASSFFSDQTVPMWAINSRGFIMKLTVQVA